MALPCHALCLDSISRLRYSARYFGPCVHGLQFRAAASVQTRCVPNVPRSVCTCVRPVPFLSNKAHALRGELFDYD